MWLPDAMPRRQSPPRTGKSRPRPEEARRPADIVKETSPRTVLPMGKPLLGTWVLTTRAGSEQDLVEELALARIEAVVRAEGMVESRGVPTFDDGSLDATFARQGFRLRGTLTGDTPALLARTFASRAASLASADTPLALSVFSADTDDGNKLAALAEEIEQAAIGALSNRKLVPLANATREGALVVQGVMRTRGELQFGDVQGPALLSPFGGGRARMAVAGDRPSRAARKVEEALHWLGTSPSAGEVCVDLGAAPGGWSWALLDKRCRVIAIDPAELHPDVAAHPKLTHEKASAFAYAPVDPVDWLFCDMAWRPIEVAQMLAKWARKGYARTLVSNIKLPMKKKADVVREVREIVHGGGWKRVRTRQLYHDRDEITLTAHR
jgi:23S rRNA (cytidine2498-2'-O)-methyltransferase